jgi:hypothetical protein
LLLFIKAIQPVEAVKTYLWVGAILTVVHCCWDGKGITGSMIGHGLFIKQNMTLVGDSQCHLQEYPFD